MSQFTETTENCTRPTHQDLREVFAGVVVNLPLNKVFHYRAPAEIKNNLVVGMRVSVPFGNRKITGFCVELTDTPPVHKTKDILKIIDTVPLVDRVMLEVTKWLANYYICGWGEALHAVIPPVVRGRTRKEQLHAWVEHRAQPVTLDPGMLEQMRRRAPKQAMALEIFSSQNDEMSARELMQKSGCTMASLRSLASKGFIALTNRSVSMSVTSDISGVLQPHLIFTKEQENAFSLIEKKLMHQRPGVVLLHGITGSGKTELYLQAIAKVVEQGRKALFLVPEISLTSQTIRRIKDRFHHVAVLHSHLLGTFHYAQWCSIKENKVDIVIGVRSSIFAPLDNVGLIILDEEHETTYKQEKSPRYHARDVAVLRAKYVNALVLLGSATPSLETYHHTITGDYDKVVLSKRVGERQLPPVEIVDMREEIRKRRGYQIISQRLEYYMKQVLARKEQVILFLNRRGFAPYIHCKRCGFVLKCSKCDIPMTFHKKLHKVLCHYCYAEAVPPDSCPDCLVNNINYRGFGTEKIEDEIIAKFPDYRILRMDSDSMRARDAHKKALADFEKGEVQILLGTQMIAKGLDFPNVTLVGVISADTTLNLPDFRSSERTFQLISQVAGRTGRGAKGGKVLVQSFNPMHYSITLAAKHDYDGFAKTELAFRKQLNYPPFGKLARVIFRSSQESKAREKACLVADTLKEDAMEYEKKIEILGPCPAPVPKINDFFRWHILLKASEHECIHHALSHITDLMKPSKSIQAIVDVDPYMML